MKLQKLHIENFRSLRNVTWEPGDLNVLIGPNAAGKSNLLKTIDFLATTANGDVREYVISNGGFGALVWNGTETRIKLKASVCEIDGVELAFTFGVERGDRSASFIIRDEFLDKLLGGQKTSESPLIGRNKLQAQIEGRQPIPVGQNGIPDDASILPYLSRPPVPGPAGAFCKYLAGWNSYQGFRVDQAAPARSSEIARRELILRGDGTNLISVLHTLYSDNSSFESDVNDAMHAAFGDEFVKLVFSPDAADQRIQFKLRWKSLSNPVPASDLSDGTLRFLYLLVILANPNPPPLIAIDEPETGLHPRMISIIAEFAAEAARRTQVAFTTHSSEFLDAMTRFNPVISVVEAHNSETTVQNISKDQLDHWLKGYTLGELFRSNGLEAMT